MSSKIWIAYHGNDDAYLPDVFLKTWISLALPTFDAIPNPEPWLAAIIHDWRACRLSPLPVSAGDAFHRHIATPEQRDRMVELLEVLRERLTARTPVITRAELAELLAGDPESGNWHRDMPTAQFVGITEAFIGILLGTYDRHGALDPVV